MHLHGVIPRPPATGKPCGDEAVGAGKAARKKSKNIAVILLRAATLNKGVERDGVSHSPVEQASG